MQTLYRGFWLLTFYTLVGAASADTVQYITECRSDSVDRPSYVQCISLQYEAAEAALQNIEATWSVELLKTAADEPDSVEEQPSATATEQSAAGENEVIAIVGNATMEGAASGSVINVDDNAVETGKVADAGPLSRAERREQFAMISGVFRKYRDEQCVWEAGLFDSVEDASRVKACKTAKTYERVRLLRQQLAEKITTDRIGRSYRGFYLQTQSGASFQDCDRRQNWWVTGDEATLQAIESRYREITSETLEMVYLEVRGHREAPLATEDGTEQVASLEVRSVVLIRPILEQDCSAPSSTDAEANLIIPNPVPLDSNLSFAAPSFVSVDSPSTLDGDERIRGLTIDELGEAGFLYGYFQSWGSACAVEQTRVCKTQTEAQYASTGDWTLIVDRSLRDEWRVRLQPGDREAVFDGALRVTIDGTEVFSRNINWDESQSDVGIVVGTGVRARELITTMRRGRQVSFDWSGSDSAVANIRFTLLGITRALDYFDNAGQ